MLQNKKAAYPTMRGGATLRVAAVPKRFREKETVSARCLWPAPKGPPRPFFPHSHKKNQKKSAAEMLPRPQ